MLAHLVLIEQAVSRLFSICKRYGKGNCEKVAVGSKGDRRQQGGTVGSKGGTRYGCNIWARGDQLFCHGQSGGTAFEGGLSTA